jgi:TatA/E family protein of Tat protein translocase
MMEAMNLGFPEMIFLFFFALIIFGPKKLPEIGRQIGRALNEFKRASNEFRSQIESEISQLDVEPRQQILPPVQPPSGAVAALTGSGLPPELAAGSESPSISKAPDA